jgi:hypothetical protein
MRQQRVSTRTDEAQKSFTSPSSFPSALAVTRKEFTDHALLLLLTSESIRLLGADPAERKRFLSSSAIPPHITRKSRLPYPNRVALQCPPKKLGDGRPRRPDFQSWQLHSPVSHASDVLEAFPFCSSFNSYWAR